MARCWYRRAGNGVGIKVWHQCFLDAPILLNLLWLRVPFDRLQFEIQIFQHLISVFRCWHLSHWRVSKPYDIIWCHILSDCHVHLRDCHIANSKTVPQPSPLQERPITPRGVQAGYRTVIITGWPILEDFTGFPTSPTAEPWTVLSFQCQIFDICNILQPL